MKYRIFFVFILAGLLISSCNKDEPDPGDEDNNSGENEVELIVLEEFSVQNGATAILLADNSHFNTGYNNVYIKLIDEDENNISDADIQYSPTFNEGGGTVSSPVIKPKYNGSTELYEGAIIFTNENTSVGKWRVGIRVDAAQLQYNADVRDTEFPEFTLITGTDNKNYVLTLAPHDDWESRLNDFTLLIHRQDSPQNFRTDDGFKVIFEPEMPDMGHGSPDNINPVSMGNGQYGGQANLTMSGLWRFHFDLIKEGDVIVEDATIDIEF